MDTGEDHQKGARIKKIEPYIDSDTFMVTYGDGVGDINIKDLISFHNSKNKIATITGVNLPSAFGQIYAEGPKIIKFNEIAKRRIQKLKLKYFFLFLIQFVFGPVAIKNKKGIKNGIITML